MRRRPTTTSKDIIFYIKLLILTITALSVLFILIIQSQKIKSDTLSTISVNYHFASLHDIGSMLHETYLIINHLNSTEDTITTTSARREIDTSLYLIDKNNKELVDINLKYGLPEFQMLFDKLQSQLKMYLQPNLTTPSFNTDRDQLIEGIKSIALTLEQLHRLHEFNNSMLIEERNKEINNNVPIIVLSLWMVLILGGFFTYKFIAAIKKILIAQKEAEEILFKEKEWSTTTLASIGDAVITTDNTGKITYLNVVAEKLTLWKLDEAKGLSIEKVFNIINEETGTPQVDLVGKVLREGVTIGLANHTVLISRDDTKRSIEDSAAPIFDRNKNIIGIVIVFHDVTHARQLAQEMSWQASHDALTGLKNRHKFNSLLQELIDVVSDTKHHHALLYLDLDQFKIVNDTCGHTAGDELLKQVSTILKSEVRDVDTVARLGGDEFGILLPSCPISQAERIATKLNESIQEFRFIWENKYFPIGVSIGLVPITETLNNISEIMRAADIACYAAKDIGGNRFHIFHNDDAKIVVRQGEMAWVSRINQALEEDRFILYFQTIETFTDTPEDKKHFEILLRLLDEEGELIAPMTFIPAAERYNLMPAIDQWVVHHSFDKISTINISEIDFFSLNISGQSLGYDDFLGYVVDELESSKLPAEKVCFEITETAAITNFPQAMEFITKLKGKGCRFALDDFGSGLSSFGYLKNLPVDFLKIDGTFVRDMLEDPIDRAMVESINSIGQTMNIKTIAEFVENRAIADDLKAMGVDYGQGYYLFRPKPL